MFLKTGFISQILCSVGTQIGQGRIVWNKNYRQFYVLLYCLDKSFKKYLQLKIRWKMRKKYGSFLVIERALGLKGFIVEENVLDKKS